MKVQQMKALRWYGINDMRLEDVAIPTIGPKDVLMKVKYSTICATDRHIYSKGVWATGAPITLGHEFAGEIVKLGTEVRTDMDGKRIQEGDLVTAEDAEYCGDCYYCKRGEYFMCLNRKLIGTDPPADGCFAEYIKASKMSVYKLLDGLTKRQGAMVEPTAVGVHAVRRGGVGLGGITLIFGAGPIGLLTLQAAKAAGADRVIITEISQKRIELAKSLGADVVINPLKEDLFKRVDEETDGLGADVVIEAIGNATVQKQGLEVTKRHGTFVVVGIAEKEASIDFNKVIQKELNVIGSIAYSHWPSRTSDFVEAMNLMKAGKIEVEKLITHEFTLDNWKKAFDMGESTEDALKVAFKY